MAGADSEIPAGAARRMPSDQGARPGGMSGRGGKRAKPAAHSCSGTSASMQSGDVESSQQVAALCQPASEPDTAVSSKHALGRHAHPCMHA